MILDRIIFQTRCWWTDRRSNRGIIEKFTENYSTKKNYAFIQTQLIINFLTILTDSAIFNAMWTNH